MRNAISNKKNMEFKNVSTKKTGVSFCNTISEIKLL